MKIIAHRGNKQVTPENTLAAFEAAARAGSHMIETDIYPCATGEIVVIHDDDVAHTTNGTGKITELDFDSIRSLDVGEKFAPAFRGQIIPTLAELLEFYQKYPELELLLEFKGKWSEFDAKRVSDSLDAAGLSPRVIVESFDLDTVRALQRVAPHLRRGLLIEATTLPEIIERYGTPIAASEALGAMCLNPAIELIEADPTLIARCHEAGLQVLAWTANTLERWNLLLSQGADAICTDRPEFLAGWLAGKADSMVSV